MRARVLSVLHAFLAVNAIGGGIFGIAGARGVPLEWLHGTPFESYRVPSLILCTVVGGTQGLASVLVGRHAPRARTVSVAAGAILLGWISIQGALIGYVSWLQPAVAVSALASLILAVGLPRAGRPPA